MDAVNGVADVEISQSPMIPAPPAANAGGTPDELREIVDKTPLFGAQSGHLENGSDKSTPIKATPYSWIEPEKIPKRDFIYGRHLIRKFVLATVAPGGVGNPNANREWYPGEFEEAFARAPMEIKIALMLARYGGMRGKASW